MERKESYSYFLQTTQVLTKHTEVPKKELET